VLQHLTALCYIAVGDINKNVVGRAGLEIGGQFDILILRVLGGARDGGSAV